MAKKAHAGHHGGAWKVAYADFVTAMMAFFMVLWLLSTSESTKAAVASYFRHPALFKNGGTGFLDQEGMIEMQQRLEEIQVQAGSGQTSEMLDPATMEMEKGVLSESAQALEETIKNSPELAGFEDQIDVNFTDEGLRIQIQDSSIQSLFDVGSTIPSSQSKKLMEVIGSTLAKLPNPIVVEGHTDSRPFQGHDAVYTNWELSGERANAARRILEDSGVDPTRVQRVVGLADRELLDPEHPMNDRNRRISILVKYQSTSPARHSGAAASETPASGGEESPMETMPGGPEPATSGDLAAPSETVAPSEAPPSHDSRSSH